MQRLFTSIGVFVLLASTYAVADERADREKLIGSWQLQDRASESPATDWIFAENGGGLRVTELDGDKVISKFQCSTQGSPCEIKTDGKKATISMWYNGAKLVQMETKGSDVVKRRFEVLAQSNIMEMEVIPVVPSGKAEILRYRRLQVSAQSK